MNEDIINAARAAVEGYLEQNNLPEEVELALNLNAGASEIEGNIDILISALSESLEANDYWRLEVYDPNPDSRQIIFTCELGFGGDWEVTYSFTPSKEDEEEEEK